MESDSCHQYHPFEALWRRLREVSVFQEDFEERTDEIHYWEGVAHYTAVGADPHFREFISGLSARERELFRFPPAGHPYYSQQTLEALEEQYPGWNSGGEYG